MKKACLAVLFILPLMLLTACGDRTADVVDYVEEYTADESIYYDEPTTLNEADHTTEETPNYIYLLKDLDYMQYVLENNFALFDVAYWSRGVDIHYILDNVRADILANPDMDADGFLQSMSYNFSPLMGIAHFSIVSPNEHMNVIGGTGMIREIFTENTLARWREPHVMDFYGPLRRQGNWTSERFLETAGDASRQAELDRFILFGKYDEVDEINYVLAQDDYAAAARMVIDIMSDISQRPFIETKSLEPNRIAYLSIDATAGIASPSPRWYAYKEQVHSFFEAIDDYEHLIIDLRRNLGGITRFFEDIVVRVIIDEPIDLNGFVFAQGGYYVQERLDEASEGANFMVLEAIATPIRPTDNHIRTIDEMLEEFHIPELNMTDMERMDYGFPIHMERLYPIRLERFGYESAFDGKIWVLTSNITVSAAQVNAWLSRESGFATHVGDISGGNFGGPRTAVALPHSGMMFRMDVFYVTDERGRPLEAGTVPHHFNRESMDALETVMALIAEGEY